MTKNAYLISIGEPNHLKQNDPQVLIWIVTHILFLNFGTSEVEWGEGVLSFRHCPKFLTICVKFCPSEWPIILGIWQRFYLVCLSKSNSVDYQDYPVWYWCEYSLPITFSSKLRWGGARNCSLELKYEYWWGEGSCSYHKELLQIR